MRVVIDTNVVVSAMIVRGGNEDQILRAWQEKAFDLVITIPILAELTRTLSHPKLRKARWIIDSELTVFLGKFATESVLVKEHTKITICRDPDDDKFLQAAIDGKAQFLVTGDKDLLDLRSHQGIRIVKPTAFLKILNDVEETYPHLSWQPRPG